MNYYSLNQYLKDTYGHKLYKLSIDGGFTCPNRDGALDTRGCIFCSAGGSGEFAVKTVETNNSVLASSATNDSGLASSDQKKYLTVTEQLERAKQRVSAKAGNDCGYIAYFQSYTNTYGHIDILRQKFFEAIIHPEVEILSIATRPDCLGDDVINLLCELNSIKPVWVELGLQTIHEKSAAYIRRCYELSVYDAAVQRLNSCGIKVVTHVILGLPNETPEMMCETVQHVINKKSWGIKLQLLHVLKGTDLARDYESGLFECMTLEEYLDILEKCVSLLPPDMVVHRLTGDGDKKLLIAPMWSADKKRTINEIHRRLS